MEKKSCFGSRRWYIVCTQNSVVPCADEWCRCLLCAQPFRHTLDEHWQQSFVVLKWEFRNLKIFESNREEVNWPKIRRKSRNWIESELCSDPRRFIEIEWHSCETWRNILSIWSNSTSLRTILVESNGQCIKTKVICLTSKNSSKTKNSNVYTFDHENCV